MVIINGKTINNRYQYQFGWKDFKSNKRLQNEQTETFSFRFVFFLNLFDQNWYRLIILKTVKNRLIILEKIQKQ